MPEPDSTLALVQRARTGDADALAQLDNLFRPLLVRYAHGRLPSAARGMTDTQDLVQVTLAKTFEKLAALDFQAAGALLTYMRCAILNQVRDEIRRASRRPPAASLTEDLPAPGGDPLQMSIGRENHELYNRALAELTTDQQRAFIMRLEMGHSYREIAHALGRRSEEAARMFVRRAVDAVADRLLEALRP